MNLKQSVKCNCRSFSRKEKGNLLSPYLGTFFDTTIEAKVDFFLIIILLKRRLKRKWGKIVHGLANINEYLDKSFGGNCCSLSLLDIKYLRLPCFY